MSLSPHSCPLTAAFLFPVTTKQKYCLSPHFLSHSIRLSSSPVYGNESVKIIWALHPVTSKDWFSGLSWSLSTNWSRNSRNFFDFVTCSSEFLRTRTQSPGSPFFPFLASKCWGILGLSTGTLFHHTLFHSHFAYLYADGSQKYISRLFFPFVQLLRWKI